MKELICQPEFPSCELGNYNETSGHSNGKDCNETFLKIEISENTKMKKVKRIRDTGALSVIKDGIAPTITWRVRWAIPFLERKS